MASISISKRKIAPKATEAISIHPTLSVTIWVEKGSVEVLSALGGKPIGRADSPGPVVLTGNVHLRNASKADAIVFVATADLGGAAKQTTKATLDEMLPDSFEPKCNVFCRNHGLLTPKPLSQARCEEVQEAHIEEFDECANSTIIA